MNIYDDDCSLIWKQISIISNPIKFNNKPMISKNESKVYFM